MAVNGHARLVDLTVRPSLLRSPIDKIHPMPFPGLNIDNLPFFAVIAATAQGKTIIHDWVYENRAIYLTELNRLGARVQLLDPHRVIVEGPTRWRGQQVVCPPALRPAVCILLGMLAARGESQLRDVYVINRGYEDLADETECPGRQHRGLPRLSFPPPPPPLFFPPLWSLRTLTPSKPWLGRTNSSWAAISANSERPTGVRNGPTGRK